MNNPVNVKWKQIWYECDFKVWMCDFSIWDVSAKNCYTLFL